MVAKTVHFVFSQKNNCSKNLDKLPGKSTWQIPMLVKFRTARNSETLAESNHIKDIFYYMATEE